jgi:hypothetical protein
MGAAAAAPRRAPVTQPARKRTSPQRRRSPRRKRPNRALASSRPRRTPAARLAQPALAGAARLPHAAVRTAGAVRDLSDSSLIVRLTRGRGWIGLLGAMLFGIVALNVISLSLNAGNGRIGAEIDVVERQNSALRAELAEQFSAGRVEAAAAELGLAVPDPQDIRYMEASDENAEKLAQLLGTDEFLAGEFEPTGYPDSGETASYVPTDSDASTSPAPSPSPAPAPAAPASSAPSSGGGGTGGTGGVGL